MTDEQETVHIPSALFEDVVRKKVGSAKKGKVGVVYLPGDWVGSEVTVVRRRKD
jgi:hypothetical protein